MKLLSKNEKQRMASKNGKKNIEKITAVNTRWVAPYPFAAIQKRKMQEIKEEKK